MVIAFFKNFGDPIQYNDFYKTRELKGGEKTIRYSKPLPIGPDVLAKLKKQKEGAYRSTDLIMTIASMSLSEMVTETKECDRVRASVPFSLRGFPDTITTFQMHNDFACVPFWVDFPKDKKTGERVWVYD